MKTPKTLRLARIGFLAVTLLATPGAFANVFVSVDIAPPPLLVYEQPVAPFPDYVWMPGYWAWDGFEYYWVPGTWVMAPEPGLLWTPGYWAFEDEFYVWHPGYWGPHVGFYGGINYGYGYPGYGFYGGFWEGGHFCYNTVYSNVTVVNVYKTYNRPFVNNSVVVNNNHVSFNGGHGGVHAHPRPIDHVAENDRHWEPTHEQFDHERGARDNPQQHFGRGHEVVRATETPGSFGGRNEWRSSGPSRDAGRYERYPAGPEERPSARASNRRQEIDRGERWQSGPRYEVQPRMEPGERPHYRGPEVREAPRGEYPAERGRVERPMMPVERPGRAQGQPQRSQGQGQGQGQQRGEGRREQRGNH